MRLLCLVTLLLAGHAIAAAQSQESDSQTLRALLEEVRQLRQDLKASNANFQRGYLLINRVQLQQTAVENASKRADIARGGMARAKEREHELAGAIKNEEEKQAKSGNPTESNQSAEMIARFKAALDKSFTEEQEQQAAVTNAEQQLRNEQAKLAELQDQLDQLDKALKPPPN